MLIVNKENVCGETYLYRKFFLQICYRIYIQFSAALQNQRKKRNIYDPQLTGNYTVYTRTRRNASQPTISWICENEKQYSTQKDRNEKTIRNEIPS